MSRFNLIEQDLSLSHPIIKDIFGNDKSARYGKVVYYNEKCPSVISAKLVYIEDERDEVQTLQEFISPETSYNECVLLSTFYHVLTKEKIHDLRKVNKIVPESLSSILQQTNGMVLYSFQFEIIAQLIMGITSDQSIELRKAFNRGHQLNVLLPHSASGRFFKGFIKSHVPLGLVYRANFEGARNLISYVRSNQ